MATSPSGEEAPSLVSLTFEDNSLLASLYGWHDRHLVRIEQELDVSLTCRGNHVTVAGTAEAAGTAVLVLNGLYGRLKEGLDVGPAEVDAMLRMAGDPSVATAEVRTSRRRITPRSLNQARYLGYLTTSAMVIALGPAGTGKTYLAVATAVAMLESGEVDRIVLSRPAVEAGERLGFLPGDLRDKVDPYLRPLYDALRDTMSAERANRRLASGEIEVAPLAFMRGRTLSDAFVILDEAQNTSPMQMKMFLTRLGDNARMVVTGDLTQVDLPAGQVSGLAEAVRILKPVEDIKVVEFTDVDVVRHELVAKIVRAWDADDRRGTP